jgi:Protein of unknown function (DUF3224)
MRYLLPLVGLSLLASRGHAQTPGPTAGSTRAEATMTARGTFDVTMTPLPPDDPAGGPFGRLLIAKQFHGDLDGTSKGQMLGAGNPATGSAGYVALEQVTGTLNGKRGSFALQHRGTMENGVPSMDVTIVPGSGTEELTGIAGRMTIIIEGKSHSYVLEYTLGGG